jgi:calcium-translocating P-type ATPase
MNSDDPLNSMNQSILNDLNRPQQRAENKDALTKLGGINGLADRLKLNLEKGLTPKQVEELRIKFGNNVFPESPMTSFFMLWIECFGDPVLLVLIVAAAVSIAVEVYTHPETGWISGVAIFIAIFMVATITATNNYAKELQFRALESESQGDERVTVIREGNSYSINPSNLVIGDIIKLQAGDSIPADSIIISPGKVLSNESALTGEPDDLSKSIQGDPFLLSSCTITDGECEAVVVGVGVNSQWGKIKANLVTEAAKTPLQEKLEEMTTQIGYIGMVSAFMTFTAMIIKIWVPTVSGVVKPSNADIAEGVINAFILAVTIVVVAIPEGLPLAVIISLAYSTQKMYKDKCLIRVLAACETMGNATNICSDKTGTLTENRMTVVEGVFGGESISQQSFNSKAISDNVKEFIVDQVCINRSAYLIYNDIDGNALYRPKIVGNKTEGALLEMVSTWGHQYEDVKKLKFNESKDKIFPFNSSKKRSTAVVHQPNGAVRIFCKGATEWVLKDCTHFTGANGLPQIMTSEKKKELEGHILAMANNALRTLLLAHRNLDSSSQLPADWETNPPDNSDLCCDCIVGIIDPLRSDVKDAVAVAQGAGLVVRMVTGDNINTAKAIARQCGILTADGTAVEGPDFRTMTLAQADALLPSLQVMARSSPEDKFLLVTRLNGNLLPKNETEWLEKHQGQPNATWENRDNFLPGYEEEWLNSRAEGCIMQREVVGVTGDGTNDAPALKAADVGMAMGITGTKVAQGASDIVILDDQFSSIVKAIKWGRAVYDNIRKFLQFQLTVNVVALVIVFIGACASTQLQPLNAVQMLWVNLVMDTFGALALGTETPTDELLKRRPYKRDASLISFPMRRHILCQAGYQLTLMFFILFSPYTVFPGIVRDNACVEFEVAKSGTWWNVQTSKTYNGVVSSSQPIVNCQSFASLCPDKSLNCYESTLALQYNYNSTTNSAMEASFKFSNLEDFKDECLDNCKHHDYTHGTLMFNAFVWCQIANEFSSRNLGDEVNMFSNLSGNWVFLWVIVGTIGAQIFLVEVGGEFVKTCHISLEHWLITIFMGLLSLPVAVAERFIPVKESEDSFAVPAKQSTSSSPLEVEKSRETAL